MYHQHHRTGEVFDTLILLLSGSPHVVGDSLRSSHSTNEWKKFVGMTSVSYYLNSSLCVVTPDNMMDVDVRSTLLEVPEEHI